jgi:hypothetical protein
MVAGISGAASGSGAELGDNEGSVLLHAPRNIVSAEAIARWATGRALRDLFIAFPRAILGRSRQATKRKTPAGAMTSAKITPQLRFGFSGSILYWPHQGLNHPLLDTNGAKPYSPAHN